MSAEASIIITTAVTNGSAQAMTLSTIGLPTGVTGEFSDSTINSGQSSTLTLTLDDTASVGTYHFTVRATGVSQTRNKTRTIEIVDSSEDASEPLDFSIASVTWDNAGITFADLTFTP